MEKDELDVCPACFGKAKAVSKVTNKAGDKTTHYVVCTECGMVIIAPPGINETEQEAVYRWNKRNVSLSCLRALPREVLDMLAGKKTKRGNANTLARKAQKVIWERGSGSFNHVSGARWYNYLRYLPAK